MKKTRADVQRKQSSAYQRLEAFIGIVDSGDLQLSEDTGRKLRELLERKRLLRASAASEPSDR